MYMRQEKIGENDSKTKKIKKVFKSVKIEQKIKKKC